MSFQDEIADGLSDLVADAGVDIEVRRGDLRITGIKGIPTKGRRQFNANADAVRTADEHDWLIMAVDYDFGSGPVPPERNDQIIDLRDNSVHEALPENNEDVRSGALKSQHRIHTKVFK